MEKFFAFLGKLSIIILIVGILAGAGYFLGRSGKLQFGLPQQPGAASTTNPEPEITDTIQPILEETISPSPTPTVQRMVAAGAPAGSGLSFSRYSLLVPEGWVETHTYENPGTPVDTLTITKGSYSIKIFQAATGGAVCIYPGDAPFDGPKSMYETFVQLTTSDNITLRRGGTNEANGDTRGYTVCQRSAEGSYQQPTTFGHTSYTTPIAPDGAILAEMDRIITSLKKI